ncbi:TonB-dependent receptor plug domain-containing protein [Parendozoicomonas haliclonae]|uniref:Vitamin B12 transporter BtuB n=2 Tax=Parendozoicomonas haliclonae TaxID=1960125 RepID=A0A1X7AIC9_9GAMM|nr:TonB-dependent receptor [Parendozoicomonas haliclonae]SMA44254.1 Vitamin B12 transporter BtuB precursor [Parendozoicomonas haliclonae]
MHTIQRTLLASAIATALSTVSVGVYAADEQTVEKVEKVTVTGSRISRVDMEGANPLAVITREDIEDSGFMTVADLLRNTTYNSLGSYTAQGNNSWGSQATINLRGLGAHNTLVLIDGRRVPWSGVMYGGSVDVNSIPAAAVERIEIMLDGASAIYGSDAVAGVVNVIMRKDYDGLQISVGAGRPEAKGNDEDSFSLLWGGSNDKGNLLISYEHDETENIVMADREFSKAVTNADVIQDVEGLSTSGRNIYHWGATQYKPLAGTCEAGNTKAGFYGPYGDSDPRKATASYCAYDYTAVADLQPSIKRDIVNVLGTYEIAENVEFNGGFSLSKRDSANTAAPVPATFWVRSNTVGGAAIFENNGFTFDPDADDPEWAGIKYRFDSLGNRVYEIEGYDLSGNAGLRGSLELDFVNDFEWDVNYTRARNDYTSNGTNMLRLNRVEELAEANADFLLPNGDVNSKYLSEIGHTWVDNTDVKFDSLDAGFGFSLGELPGGDIGYYFGVQRMNYEMDRSFDPLSASGDVIGVFGGQYGGDRTVKAVFGEIMLPILDNLEANFAVRQDRYSDFGKTTNPKFSIRYQPMDNLVLRGSYGTSFKAPNFQQLYTPENTGYYTVTDYKACKDQGISLGQCNIEEDSIKVTNVGNKELGPEESKMLTLGAVFEPMDDLTLRFDFYNIKTEDLITQISSDYLLQAEAIAGSSAAVIRDGQGFITQVYTSNVNIAEQEQSGIDLGVSYDLDLNDLGTVDLSTGASYLLKYEYADEPGLEAYDHVGLNGTPEYRINATIGYTTPEKMHRIAISAYHITDQYDWVNQRYENGKLVQNDKEGHIASHTTFNVNYRLNLPWDGTANVGVRNLFDRDPSFRYDGKSFNEQLYSIQGRVFYADYTQRF